MGLLDFGPLILGTVLTLAAVASALLVARRADSPWAPVAVVGGGTVLGLAALGLAIAVTASATDREEQGGPSLASTPPPAGLTPVLQAVATSTIAPSPTGAATEDVPVTATPTLQPTATTPATSVPTPTPTPSPTEPPVTPTVAAGPPPTQFVNSAEGGVRWRSACAPDALLAGWWPNGTEVEVLRSDSEGCAGWSLVRSGTLVSWVNDEALMVTAPTSAPTTATAGLTPAAATPMPRSSPTPAARGSYRDAVESWATRLDELEVALDSNVDRAVQTSDWAAAATNAARFRTAAIALRTEIEQTTPFVEELAPGCRPAMTPLAEMASALVRMADAHEEWLGGGLVDNDAALRVSAQRDAVQRAASEVTAALEGCS